MVVYRAPLYVDTRILRWHSGHAEGRSARQRLDRTSLRGTGCRLPQQGGSHGAAL